MSTFHLPDELWLMIVHWLCYHCTRDPRRPSPVPDPRFQVEYNAPIMHAPLATLARLCQVSKKLQAMATPVLYHCPITKRPVLLLETLLNRSDLAKHVLELHHDMWDEWPRRLDRYPPAFLELYRRKVNQLGGPKLLIEDREPPETISKRNVHYHVRDTVVMELLPRLEAVTIEAVNRKVCLGIDQDSLINLTCVSVSNEDFVPENDKGLYSGTYLTKAAPYIKSMHYFQTVIQRGARAFPRFPKATTLELEKCNMARSALFAALRAHPSISTFAYSDGGYSNDVFDASESVTARDIQDALVRRYPGLEKLHVDMAQHAQNGWEDPENRGFDQSLTKLKELVHLSTESGCLEEPEGQSLIEYLAMILPPSLQYLRISLNSWDEERNGKFREALVALPNMQTEVLPAMEKIVICDTELMAKEPDYYDGVKHGWEQRGVVFQATDVIGPFGCRSF